ncbi:MAG: YicC/YloC family endoribonuclease [Kofleriaceae bacterium]
MTGYGRGVATSDGQRVTVDIRSVNHRFLDLKLRGAPIAPVLEEAAATRVRAAIERGSVTVSIHVASEAATGGMRIDPAAAQRAYRALTELASQLTVAGPTLEIVLAQPGVVIADDHANESLPVVAALDTALAELERMRTNEGLALRGDLLARLDGLAALRTQIAELAATLPQQLTKRLHERVRKLLEPQELAAIDPGRLAQEVALLADRSDITEELVRLASHLDQARALLAGTGKGSVGRRLDFLIQEIGRELNTIGSKSALTEITAAVVDAKAALEKVREQVQNVE